MVRRLLEQAHAAVSLQQVFKAQVTQIVSVAIAHANPYAATRDSHASAGVGGR